MGDYGLITALIAGAIVAALGDLADRVIHPIELLRCALEQTQVCIHQDGNSW